MRPGGAVLAALRTDPDTAIAAWGFIVRGAILVNAVGGGCTLACAQYLNSSIYQITATAGAGDFYIPYNHGEARHCDVPAGQPNGTLVVTFPMNGCALEVRDIGGGINRFYHDADGNSMPAMPPGNQKFRATAVAYQGAQRIVHERALRWFDVAVQNDRLNRNLAPNAGGYEHNVICVKDGANWKVYASANIRLNGDAWQVKDNVPYALGTFAD